jgi:hypothetical protein
MIFCYVDEPHRHGLPFWVPGYFLAATGRKAISLFRRNTDSGRQMYDAYLSTVQVSHNES